MAVEGRRAPLRRWGDLVLYLFRPFFYWNALWPLLGWEVGRMGGPVVSTIAFGTAMALGAGVLFLLNDVVDADKDQMTAPGRPLAAGLAGRSQAVVLATATTAAMIALLWLAVKRAEWVGLLLLALVISAVLGFVYSMTKRFGVLASLIYAMIPVGTALLAWYVRGHHNSTTLLLVLAEMVLIAVAMNSTAALNDIDDDARVGNRTLPVRVGPDRTISYVLALSVGSGIVILLLCIHLHRSLLFLLFLAPIVIRSVRDFRRIRTSFGLTGVGRPGRIAVTFPLARATQAHSLVVLILLSWRVGIVAMMILIACDILQRVWIRLRFGQWSLPAGTD